MEKLPAVYIVASRRNGTLYTGVTSDLIARIHQHRSKSFKGFTAEYGADRLVWFEMHGEMESAIVREKRIKEWKRAWELALIEAANPTWRDLAEDFGFPALPEPPPSSRRKPGPRAAGDAVRDSGSRLSPG
ncbi:GIY-YIG nuclease family protein [Sphingomonas sp. LB-2]|uniref:GIY-YIG nuclease family protein n=1 Tax=Sphingomonas caeni TaxID=2984949 RepID=UPI002232494C|nr:GIY-YIG nuclease family protein [Sphingomonas caeni]MCW3848906.1 GIY-YIG nuclease family protein [Sphingomonas caeni]